MIDKVWSKWNGLNRNAKIAIIGIAVVAIWWITKWILKIWNLMVSPIIETIGLPLKKQWKVKHNDVNRQRKKIN